MSEYRIVTFRRICNSCLKSEWLRIEKASGVQVHPFHRYDYIRYIDCQTRLFGSGYYPLYVCVEEASTKRILLIAPLKKSLFCGRVRMLGDIQGCGRCDFIYDSELNRDERLACLDYLFQNVHFRWKLRRLIPESEMIHYIVNYLNPRKKYGEDCVSIQLPDSFEEHFSRLSKSVRQNIRTAVNRMEKQQVNYRLSVYSDLESLKSVRDETLNLYIRRQLEKYKKQNLLTMFLHNYWRFYYRYIRHDSKSLYCLPEAFVAVLYLNDKLAGYMSAFVTPDGKSLVVPRLAIDSQYSFFSPGYVLINELIKYCLSSTSICEIDLSRGTERYKTDLGGIVYPTVGYLIK